MDSNDRPRDNTSGDDRSGTAQARSEQAASAPVTPSSVQGPDDSFLSRRSDAVERRSLLPWLIAALAVVLVVGFMLLAGHHERESQQAIDAAKTPDSYAPNVQIGSLQMSQATNFAGGKLTYIDGQVTNGGDRTVRGITVSVIFKNDVGEPPQQQTMPIMLIRTREPYVDTEPVSAEPLKPGDHHDFRLIFDHVTATWNQQYPTIQVLRVQTNP
jgi:hypothetical protein